MRSDIALAAAVRSDIALAAAASVLPGLVLDADARIATWRDPAL